MISFLQKEALRAEIATLEDLISSRSEEDDPIGVNQFGQRAAELRLELERIEVDGPKAGGVALFFSGEPVFGSLGIKAAFAGEAVKVFQEIVAKRFAGAERGDLGERGRVPMRLHSDLMISDVARGSFGIVLEEFPQTLPLVDTQLKTALDEVARAIDIIATDDADEFDLFMADADARYLQSLGQFFVLLDDEHATVRIVEGEVDRALSQVEVHRARDRIASVTIEEKDSNHATGRLFLLPEHRKFELRQESGVTLYGLVSKDFPKEVLEEARDSSDVISQKWRVKIRERTIRRPNRTAKKTHVLLGLLERIDEPL